jgi:cytochrome c peroxidase
MERMKWWKRMTWGLALCATSAWAEPADSLVAAGKKLFFDARLSADGVVSCATCHDPKRAFADTHRLSPGVFQRTGTRHTPALIARSSSTLQFWDGRAATLEQQVLEPIKNPKEMAMTVEAVLDRLQRDREYQGWDAGRLAAALAAYIRTIQSVDSPVDRFLRQGVPLSALELEGLRLFRDKARCYLCHSGDHYTDESFHNTGVAWQRGQLADAGRAFVTGKAYHRGAFKTPTLREVARTAPYMHDGSIATLAEVVEFYDEGGRKNPWLDENIQPLHLSDAEKRALVAFLAALSGRVKEGE